MTFVAVVIGMACVLGVVAVGVRELRRMDRLYEAFREDVARRLEQRKETR